MNNTQAKPRAIYQVGQTVYDRASKREAAIVARANSEDEFNYELDSTVPLNPTGNGAFPDRWRHAGEICSPDDPARLADFNY